MRTLHIYLILALLAFSSGIANAKVIFVNGGTGSDLYDGSAPVYSSLNHGPKKTVSGALLLASTDDDIYIANSYYNETVTIKKSYNFHLSSNVTVASLVMNGTDVKLNLDGNIYIANSINFMKGYIMSDSTSMPIVNYTTSQLGGSLNSFTSGPFGVKLNSPYTHRILNFPVGKDTNFRPMNLDVYTGDNHTTVFIGEMFNATPPDLCTPSSEGIDNVSSVRYWTLTSTCICVKEGKITLTYGQDDGVDLTKTVIVKDDQEVNIGCWENLQGSITGDSLSGIITSTCRFMGCGTFTLGNVEEPTIPLPVSWIKFDANRIKSDVVKLSWATASEINNDYFTVERTTDMNNWEEVCRVPGHGNTAVMHDYSCNDSTFTTLGQSTVYYRPKQVDFNGVYEYYRTIKLRLDNNGPGLVDGVYPNPATDRINIRYKATDNGLVNIRLTNMEGKVILTSKYSVQPGFQVVDIDLPEESLTRGMYVLEVESDGQVSRHKVYKQ